MSTTTTDPGPDAETGAETDEATAKWGALLSWGVLALLIAVIIAAAGYVGWQLTRGADESVVSQREQVMAAADKFVGRVNTYGPDDVGSDITGTMTFFGSPSAKARERIAADLEGPAAGLGGAQADPWESDTASDAEDRAMERKLIRQTGANDPAIGYNLTRWRLRSVRRRLSPACSRCASKRGRRGSCTGR